MKPLPGHKKFIVHNVVTSRGEKSLPAFKLMETEGTTYFGEILDWWDIDDKKILAIKDSDGYIGLCSIATGQAYIYNLGNAGYDHCFMVEDIPALAEKLGIEYKGEY